MTSPLPLPSLRGQVHRFCGVVDRFGTRQRQEGTDRTLCVRNLRVAETDQALDVDHWWFDLREIWAEAGVRIGDTVMFTVKVTRCTKGWTDPGDPRPRMQNPRRQVIGFAARPRSVVVLRRRQTTNRTLTESAQELQQARARLAEAQGEIGRLESHRAALLSEAQQRSQCLQTKEQLIRSQSSQIQNLQRCRTRLRRLAIASALGGCVLGGGAVLLLQGNERSTAFLQTSPADSLRQALPNQQVHA